MLVIMAGPPAAGKSALAHALAEITGAVVLDKDVMRGALFPAELIEYSREQDDFVVRVMLKVAGWIIRRDADRIVILDGRPFAKKYQLDQVVAFAEWIRTSWRIIECTCADDVARERLSAASHPARDRDFDLYLRVKADWEEIKRPKLVLDTSSPVEELARKAAAYVRASNESKLAEKSAL